MSAADASSELKKWFVKFGIESWWNKKVEELSKGMAQKIQFITTVVHRPKLLILDEPFSGFDPVNTQLISEEILRLKDDGATIMLSTHNMESVEELCDNIALFNKSHVVLSGGVEDIRREYGNNNIEIGYTDAEGTHLDVVPAGESANGVLKEYMERGARICSCRELMPRMNDIFIKLVKED